MRIPETRAERTAIARKATAVSQKDQAGAEAAERALWRARIVALRAEADRLEREWGTEDTERELAQVGGRK